MKEKLTKLSELQASLLIAGIISGVLFLGSLVGLFFNLPGLPIGVVIGTAVEFLYLWLASIGATVALKQGKSGLFLLTYFLRMFVFVGLFAVLTILQYKAHIDFFNYSCWAMLIAFAPSTIISIATQLMNKEGK